MNKKIPNPWNHANLTELMASPYLTQFINFLKDISSRWF